MQRDIRLDHVAIAVDDLDEAVRIYSAVLGPANVERESVDSEGVRVAFFELGDVRIELLEPTAADTPVGRFLRKNGPGLHHVTFRVPDIEDALDRCRRAGLETAGDAPRPGAGGRRVAFLHPRGTQGVLIELAEPPGRDGG